MTSTASAARWAFAITVELTDEDRRLMNLTDEEWDELCESGNEPSIGIANYLETLGDDTDDMLPALDLIKDKDETHAVIYFNADRETALAQLNAAVSHYSLAPFTVTSDGNAA